MDIEVIHNSLQIRKMTMLDYLKGKHGHLFHVSRYFLILNEEKQEFSPHQGDNTLDICYKERCSPLYIHPSKARR